MLVEDFARNACAGKQTDPILLDFSKAFDKVSQSKLLWKLHQYGIWGKALDLVHAFLGHSQWGWGVRFGPSYFRCPTRLGPIYLTMKGSDSHRILQNDLDTLSSWESRWDMKFNSLKCQVIRVTTSRRPIKSLYKFHGQVLEAVTSARYLGVDISSGLSWNSHGTPI